jgi:hypothetical protein
MERLVEEEAEKRSEMGATVALYISCLLRFFMTEIVESAAAI